MEDFFVGVSLLATLYFSGSILVHIIRGKEVSRLLKGQWLVSYGLFWFFMAFFSFCEREYTAGFITISVGAFCLMGISLCGLAYSVYKKKDSTKKWGKYAIGSFCTMIATILIGQYIIVTPEDVTLAKKQKQEAIQLQKKYDDQKKYEEWIAQKKENEEKKIISEIEKVSNMNEEELEIFNTSFEEYMQSMDEVEARRKAIADTSNEISRRKKEASEAKMAQQKAEMEAKKQAEIAEANKPENKIKKAVGSTAKTSITSNGDGSYNVIVTKDSGSLYKPEDMIEYGSTDEEKIRRTNAVKECRLIVNNIKETSVPIRHIEIHLTGRVTDIEGYQRTDDIVICEISGNASYKSSDNQSFANAASRFWTIRGL